MKRFRVRLCRGQQLPFTYIYNGEEQKATDTILILSAFSTQDVLNRLQGTSTKVISNINSIRSYGS